MKVAFVLAHLGARSGGIAVTVPALARALAEQSVKPVLVGAIDDEGEKWAREQRVSCLGRPVLGPRGFAFAPGAHRMAKAFSPQVVHLNGLWTYASLIAHGLRRRLAAPTVISPHGMLDPWALRRSRWKKTVALALFERANLRSATCLHALCAAEATACRAFGLRNPIAVVPNGVDLPEEVQGRAPERPRTLLFLSRIDAKKGVHELVRGWHLSRAGARGWCLRIVGWGDARYGEATRRLVQELGLHHSVELAGPAFGEAKDRAFREADAFILPSYSEGLPMAVLEAWAYALPVLKTRGCNLPEGFERGAALEIGTEPERIAEGIRTLVAMSDRERQAMGRAGRVLVEERFTWPAVAHRMIEVYEWVLGGGAPPPCVVTD